MEPRLAVQAGSEGVEADFGIGRYLDHMLVLLVLAPGPEHIRLVAPL